MTDSTQLSNHPRQRNASGQGGLLRDDIVDAAIRLLADDTPPSALSLRAVAREARITAPAIYAHFSGLHELLAVVVTRRFADFAAALDSAERALPEPRDPLEVLRARTLAYCAYGLQRQGDYELLFGNGDAYGGVPYENSAGETAFLDLVTRVRQTRPDADAQAIAAVLWPALHGLVSARRELADFPWPPLDDQVDRLIDGLVVRAPSVGRSTSPTRIRPPHRRVGPQ